MSGRAAPGSGRTRRGLGRPPGAGWTLAGPLALAAPERPPASLATRSPRRLEAFRRRWRLSLERRQAGQAPTQLRLTTCYDKVLSSGGRGCLGAPHEGWRCPCAAPTCLGGSAFRYVHVSAARARASSWSSRVRPFGRGFSDGIPKGPRGFQRPAALGLWPVLRPPPPACRTRRAETTKVRGSIPPCMRWRWQV